MQISKLASAIYNDIVAGLSGYTSTPAISLEQLEGNLSEKITKIRKIVISVMADIEATIDYPEYDLEEVTNAKILKVLDEVDILLDSLEKSFYNGKILREGISTAIIGRPNAGKSSFLNFLLGEEKAIELLAKAGFDAWDFSMFAMARFITPRWSSTEAVNAWHPAHSIPLSFASKTAKKSRTSATAIA